MPEENPKEIPSPPSNPAVEDPAAAEEKARKERERLAQVWDMVNHGRPNENLDPLINESVKEPDINEGLERTKLDVDYLRAEVKRERTQIFEVVTGELAELKRNVDGLASLQATLEKLLKSKPEAIG